MQQYLESIKLKIKSKLKDAKVSQIKFVNARYRFEIEIPNEICKGNSKLEELVITS